MATMTPGEFARILAALPERLPVSAQYDADLPQKAGVWWTSQREHMVAWFGQQHTLGQGAYSRGTPVTDARVTYNRLNAPGALLWIAEAVGEERAVVQVAADAARAVPPRSRPAAIRRVIAWERIRTLACERARGGVR